jgi:hypothetical protein
MATPAYFTGCVKDTPDDRDVAYVQRVNVPGAAPIVPPPTVDLSADFPPPFDQGQSNTCSANATANGLGYLLKKAAPAAYDKEGAQSRLFIYWNARAKVAKSDTNVDQGIQIRDAVKAVAQFNSVPETTWPFAPVEQRFMLEPSAAAKKAAKTPDVFRYRSVAQDIGSVREVLASGKPIVLGIEVRQGAYSPDANGVVTMTGDFVGWHAVLLAGYDDATRLFKIQNSWGDWYGKAGYFFLSYDWVLNPATASDLWCLDFFDAPPAPAPIPGPSSTVTIYNDVAKAYLALRPDGAPTQSAEPFRWTRTLVEKTPGAYSLKAGSALLSSAKVTRPLVSTKADDGSGRQRFAFSAVDGGFEITVPRGLDGSTRNVVTANASIPTLETARHGPRQKWVVKPAA